MFKLVVSSHHHGDMLSLPYIKAQCQLEQQHILPIVTNPAGIVSIPTLVMCMHGKAYGRDGCDAITDQDVGLFRSTISICAMYYYNKNLTANHIPKICHENREIIRQFFFYMAPNGFHKLGDVNQHTSLHHVLSYINWASLYELDSEIVYKTSFESAKLSNDFVKITAISIPDQDDVKYSIFSDYLIGDLQKYFVLALGLILCIMMFYTKSFALMLATVLNVAISLVLACAIYFFIFRLKFFPFINLLAGLVLIAVGADDVFIFYDTWKQVRMDDPQLTMSQSLSRTYSHAALSIFVTSFTTASAFFTNTISSTISTIRCFGIFAGIAIIVNFFVMVVWTPACVVCIEKVWTQFIRLLHSKSDSPIVERVERFFDNRTSKLSEAVYGRFLPKVVGKLWYVWVFILVGLGIGASIIVFYKPRLELPKSRDFQLFPDSNVLENWDLNYQDSFPFQVKDAGLDKIPLYVVFGFEPKDDGNWLNPDDPGGNVSEDALFDFYSNTTQLWLTELCTDLKNQSFMDYHYKNQPCALPKYGELFQQYCNVPMYRHFLGPCCTGYKPPYERRQLQSCMPGLQVLLEGNADLLGSPIYDANNIAKGFMMFTYTNLTASMSYDQMADNYKILKTYFDERFATAPAGLKTAFFTGRYTFTFFDLQGAIAHGTYLSIVLSIAVAFIIMFLTTMNLIITFYAIVTIAFAIICTVASIVLLGWDLNIIESITISLAVGLSIDFTIHYGVAYRLSRAKEPRLRVNESFTRVGSAVAMAALTTFAAGIAMMPARVIAYIKLGTFLMLVMTFSWVYSTFLFQSICRIIGPRHNFCQISFSSCKKKTDDHRRLVANDEDDDDDDDSLITFS